MQYFNRYTPTYTYITTIHTNTPRAHILLLFGEMSVYHTITTTIARAQQQPTNKPTLYKLRVSVAQTNDTHFLHVRALCFVALVKTRHMCACVYTSCSMGASRVALSLRCGAAAKLLQQINRHNHFNRNSLSCHNIHIATKKTRVLHTAMFSALLYT